MLYQNKDYKLHGIRGATTSKTNSKQQIEVAVKELVSTLVSRNSIDPKQIVSITFSVTADLDACFPAAIARQQKGWEQIALLDCQQMFVTGDLSHCIRILAHVWLPHDQAPQHPYLRGAQALRPDRSINE